VFVGCLCPVLPQQQRPHVTGNTLGTQNNPCQAIPTGSAISRLQPFDPLKERELPANPFMHRRTGFLMIILCPGEKRYFYLPRPSGGEIVVFHPVGRRNDGINGHGKDIGIEDTDFRVQAESFMPGFDQVVIHVD